MHPRNPVHGRLDRERREVGVDLMGLQMGSLDTDGGGGGGEGGETAATAAVAEGVEGGWCYGDCYWTCMRRLGCIVLEEISQNVTVLIPLPLTKLVLCDRHVARARDCRQASKKGAC